jgi:photosystem II stability/assembly factor-like uncharacterized protein
MRQLLLQVILGMVCLPAMAQNGWRVVGPEQTTARFDDIFFINDSTGWLAGGRNGTIYKTNDGGNSWTTQFVANKYLRSIEFASPLKGFCGSVDSTFYKTTDGGATWVDIRASINPRIPGICGLSAPDSTTIYGCGVWYRPAFIIKSSDGGNTWTRIDMSAYASGLVDILFINKDTGWVCGISPRPLELGIILHTVDGGNTWQLQYNSYGSKEFVWKLQTPDRKHFFAAIEGFPGNPVRLVQSGDAGKNWSTITVKPYYCHIQAAGFLTSKIGFIGGDTSLYQTTDGGITWSKNLAVGSTYNRFFRVNDHLAFLTGVNAYKYNAQTDASVGAIPDFDEIHSLKVFPNPASDHIRVEIVIRNPTTARLEVFDTKGTLIANLFEGRINADSRTFMFPVKHHPAGMYFVVLRTNEGKIARSFIKQ